LFHRAPFDPDSQSFMADNGARFAVHVSYRSDGTSVTIPIIEAELRSWAVTNKAVIASPA